VDLKATCLTPTLLQQEFDKGKSIKQLQKADCKTSPGIPAHGEAVLQDFGERLQQFMSQCEVDEDRCHYYHGGIAETNLVSHEMHCRDFLFDRADLASKGVEGQIVDSGEYWNIVSSLNRLDPEERAGKLMTEILRQPEKPLQSLDTLATEMKEFDNWVLICGGPFTPITALLQAGGQELADKIGAVYAMGGAWDIHKAHNQNFFANQFNFGADLKAAQAVFVQDLKADAIPQLKCNKYLIPTETCKHPKLCLTAQDIQREMPATHPSLIHYYQLWYDINSKRPFYLFDFSPVFAAYEHIRSKSEVFEWINCTCKLNDQGTLLLEEGGLVDHNLYGASRELSAKSVTAYYALLKKLRVNASQV